MIACPDESALSLRTGPIEPLAGVTVVTTPLLPEAPARAAAVHAAHAPVVVLGETHVFAEPDWAGRLLRAHEDPGSRSRPGSETGTRPGAELGGLLMDYGPFPQAGNRREIADVSSYNAAYKRAALLELGDGLDHCSGRAAR